MRRFMFGVAVIAVAGCLFLLVEWLQNPEESPRNSQAPETQSLEVDEEKCAQEALGNVVDCWVEGRPATTVRISLVEHFPAGTTMSDELMVQVGRFRHVNDLYLYAPKVSHQGLAQLEGLTELRKLELCFNAYPGDGALAHVRALPKLEYLELFGTAIECNDLQALRGMQTLKTLRIYDGLKVRIRDAGLEHIATMPNLELLDLKCAKLTDAGLACLGNLRHLRVLDLTFGGCSGEGLKHLVACAELEELTLRSSSITGAGIAHLPPLPKLRKLMIDSDEMTDAGLAGVARCQNLESVDLYGCKTVTDAGAAHLATLDKLEQLDLRGTQIGDAGLRHLSGLVKLRELHLSRVDPLVAKEIPEPPLGGKPITDAGLRHLAGLTQMEILGLGGSDITDEGLQWLKGMKHLKQLGLRGTRVTEAGIAQLREAIPVRLDILGTELGNKPGKE